MALHTTSNGSERSTSELLSQFSEQLGRLVRDEVQLAVTEMRRRAKGSGAGVVMLAVGVVLLLLGGAAAIAAAIAALALILPVWLSALIVGVVLLLIGAVLAGSGRGRLRRTGVPVPQDALAGLRADLRVVARGATR